jgi:hypothetical protein
VADPLTTPEDAVAALELVLEHARGYLAEMDAPVRTPATDEAARTFGGPLPEHGDGTLAVIRRLLEQGTEAHVRSGGPRFFHWVIGGSTPAALAADWLAVLLDQNPARGIPARSRRSWRRSRSPGCRTCSGCRRPGAAS